MTRSAEAFKGALYATCFMVGTFVFIMTVGFYWRHGFWVWERFL